LRSCQLKHALNQTRWLNAIENVFSVFEIDVLQKKFLGFLSVSSFIQTPQRLRDYSRLTSDKNTFLRGMPFPSFPHQIRLSRTNA